MSSKPMTDRLKKLARIIQRPDEQLRHVVYPLRVKYYEEAFRSSGRSTGKAWAGLEPTYRMIQADVGDSLRPLVSSINPKLEPSFSGGSGHIFRVNGNILEVGSSVPYASHVAEGGVNPMTGENFPGRNPAILSDAQVKELSQRLIESITEEMWR